MQQKITITEWKQCKKLKLTKFRTKYLCRKNKKICISLRSIIKFIWNERKQKLTVNSMKSWPQHSLSKTRSRRSIWISLPLSHSKTIWAFTSVLMCQSQIFDQLNFIIYNNSNWGLVNISYSITAAVSFFCSYLFFKIEDKS